MSSIQDRFTEATFLGVSDCDLISLRLRSFTTMKPVFVQSLNTKKFASVPRKSTRIVKPISQVRKMWPSTVPRSESVSSEFLTTARVRQTWSLNTRIQKTHSVEEPFYSIENKELGITQLGSFIGNSGFQVSEVQKQQGLYFPCRVLASPYLLFWLCDVCVCV